MKVLLFLLLTTLTISKNIETLLARNFIQYDQPLFWSRPFYYALPILPTAFVFDSMPFFTKNTVLLSTANNQQITVNLDSDFAKQFSIHNRAFAGHTLVPNQRSTETLNSSLKIFFCDNSFDLSYLAGVKIDLIEFYAKDQNENIYYYKKIQCQ